MNVLTVNKINLLACLNICVSNNIDCPT